MPYPPFFADFPQLDIPFDPAVVSTRAVRSPQGLVVFFDIHQDTSIPPHSHGDQWGTVLAGELQLTMNGETVTYRPGETYYIPAGTEHAAALPAGSQVMDVFAEADRYPLKGA